MKEVVGEDGRTVIYNGSQRPTVSHINMNRRDSKKKKKKRRLERESILFPLKCEL